jgi:hypothetical protein
MPWPPRLQSRAKSVLTQALSGGPGIKPAMPTFSSTPTSTNPLPATSIMKIIYWSFLAFFASSMANCMPYTYVLNLVIVTELKIVMYLRI